jgi:hypothetical protein
MSISNGVRHSGAGLCASGVMGAVETSGVVGSGAAECRLAGLVA